MKPTKAIAASLIKATSSAMIAFSGMAGLAGAETITQTVRYHFAEHGSGFNGYNKFDPALGTLNAVNYSFTGSAGSSVFEFFNTKPNSTVTFVGNVTFFVATLAGGKTFTMDYTDTLSEYGLVVHQLTGSYSFNRTFDSPDGLAAWIGQGYYSGQDYELSQA